MTNLLQFLKYCYVDYTHTHMCTRNAKHTAAVTQLFPPSVPTGMLETLKPSVTNPLGAGPVTRRRDVQASWIEVAEPSIMA